ncbi:MAG TPA: hypothetical protein VKZ68_11285 [Ohtaekwangia sp.]|nr:hypothetical protein [Ohtaekwangia sp.]
MKKTLSFLCILVMCLCVHMTIAQQILLDKPVRAGEITVFPEVGNDNNFYYLPDKLRLATHSNGKPQLSFLRYVENTSGPEATDEAEGGGIVHAVVELSVTPEQLAEARQQLRRIKPNGVIVGPIVYKSGTIALITSFNAENGELTKQVIGLGKAPVLDGGKAAVSVQLTKKGAKLLWESFKTPTPDLTFSFEMDMAGFRSPIRAKIEANFDQIYEHKNFQAAVAAPILAAEIKASFDDLIKSGAIKITQVGSDEDMERAIEAAYTKLTNMMFDPAGGTGTPNLSQLTGQGTQPGLLDRATTMLNTARTEARTENDRRRSEARTALTESERRVNEGGTPAGPSPNPTADTTGAFHPSEGVSSVPSDEASRIEEDYNRRNRLINQDQVAVPSFAIAASFEMRTVRQRGTFVIDLNKFNADNLTIRFDENVGTVNCDDCFQQINLDDPLYKQRFITAFLDGANAIDFVNYINGVTVTMRKKHAQGDITTKEIRIDRTNFNQEANNFKMVYGWKNDNDRSKWLDYEYKTEWFFFGGHTVTSDWQESDAADVKLSAPFVRRIIDVEADPTLINAANVRAIDVKVYSTLGEGQQVKEMRMNARANQLSGQLEIIQAKDVMDYEYEVIWHLTDGSTRSSGRRVANTKSLFVDNI